MSRSFPLEFLVFSFLKTKMTEKLEDEKKGEVTFEERGILNQNAYQGERVRWFGDGEMEIM